MKMLNPRLRKRVVTYYFPKRIDARKLDKLRCNCGGETSLVKGSYNKSQENSNKLIFKCKECKKIIEIVFDS